MASTARGLLAVGLTMTLVLTVAVGVVHAAEDAVLPDSTTLPIPTAVSSIAPAPAPDAGTAADPTSGPLVEPQEQAPNELAPSPSAIPGETGAPSSAEPPSAASAAILAEPLTNLPSLDIQLPDGYTLDELNASKSSIPADPDAEPHSLATLVDPADASNNLVDVPLEEIKGRGNFTWTLNKKPYQIKFESTTSVLGIPAAKTWILLANHVDPSLMRNKLAYDLAASFGLPGAPDSRFIDLTINGQFLGNYLLTDKVEVKKNRLELQDPGGLLLELDNSYGLSEEFHFTTQTSGSVFVLKDAVGDVEDPLPVDLAASYGDTQAFVNEFESYLYAAEPDWSKISAMIDVASFVRYHFVLELAANPDIILSSVYFWRDGPSDVLHAGPVWDFDIAFANYTAEDFGGDPVQDYNKNARFLRDRGTGWLQELFRNEEFAAIAADLYAGELEQKVNAVVGAIETNATALQASSRMNFERWTDVLGRPSIIPGARMVGPTWQEEVSYLRNWVRSRAAYLASAHDTGIPILAYSAHSAMIGWQSGHTSGQIVGTTGRGLQMEALDIAVPVNTIGGSINGRAYVQNLGWTPWQSGATRLGTTGQGLRLEAVELELTARLAAEYDIAYRVHVKNIGWMTWVMNGATAGTSGQGLQVEAIQVRLLGKSAATRGSSVRYAAHVASIGWLPAVADGAEGGTTGRSLSMQALKATLSSSEYDGSLSYRAHIQDLGWTNWTDSPDFAGTVGRSLRIEALQLTMKGELAEHYSIRYSVHVQDVGWQAWVADGEPAGKTGQSKSVEAIKIELVPKSP